jgi:hypothetical protein
MSEIPEIPFESCEQTFDPITGEEIWTCSTIAVDMGPTRTGTPIVFHTDGPRPPGIDPPHPGESFAQTTVATVTATAGVETSRNGGGAKEAAPTGMPTAVGTDDNDDDGGGSIGGGGQGRGGIAPGAVAGIAISTAIIGAAIAFLLAFLLFKRRNHREGRRAGAGLGVSESHPELTALSKPAPESPYQMPQRHNSHSRNISMASETGANASTPLNTFRHSHGAVSSTTIVAATMAPPTAVSASATTEDYLMSLGGILPPPVENTTIRAKFTALFAQIHSHVETFYRDVNASITPSMEPELAQFGTQTGERDMAELLENVGNPTIAIKHALVEYVLGIASPPSGDRLEGEGRSLFPKCIVGLAGGQLAESLKRERQGEFFTFPPCSAVHLL